jgi:hypothetical protein
MISFFTVCPPFSFCRHCWISVRVKRLLQFYSCLYDLVLVYDSIAVCTTLYPLHIFTSFCTISCPLYGSTLVCTTTCLLYASTPVCTSSWPLYGSTAVCTTLCPLYIFLLFVRPHAFCTFLLLLVRPRAFCTVLLLFLLLLAPFTAAVCTPSYPLHFFTCALYDLIPIS